MRQVRADLARLARFPWPVLILGPSGSGKAVAARLLHDWSPRAGKPFIGQSMTNLAPGLELAEFTGHSKGSFTGAFEDVPGGLEAAHGGTLFLDEIDSASVFMQGALLQLLEDREVKRLGERRARRVDIRFVFATNADLDVLVRNGKFREDLFHRLGCLHVRMPGLREHAEDIPLIARAAYAQFSAVASDAVAPPLTDVDVERLQAYEWPGNVRQLQSAVMHYVVFGRWPDTVRAATSKIPWRDRLDDALRRHNGVVRFAAIDLERTPKTIYQELRRRRESNAALPGNAMSHRVSSRSRPVA